MRAWVAVGTRETSKPQRNAELVALSSRLAQALRREKGRGTARLVVDDGARHHEDAWAARLPDALRWLFGARSALALPGSRRSTRVPRSRRGA